MGKPVSGVYDKVRYDFHYDSGTNKSVVGERLKVIKTGIIMTDEQAKILNTQFRNSGIKYELVEPEEDNSEPTEKEILQARYLELSGDEKVNANWGVKKLTEQIALLEN